MVTRISSLCGNCSKNCNSCVMTELALRKSLTYIYLNNGSKITNSCNFYTVKNLSALTNILQANSKVTQPKKF